MAYRLLACSGAGHDYKEDPERRPFYKSGKRKPFLVFSHKRIERYFCERNQIYRRHNSPQKSQDLPVFDSEDKEEQRG